MLITCSTFSSSAKASFRAASAVSRRAWSASIVISLPSAREERWAASSPAAGPAASESGPAAARPAPRRPHAARPSAANPPAPAARNRNCRRLVAMGLLLLLRDAKPGLHGATLSAPRLYGIVVYGRWEGAEKRSEEHTS